MGGTLTVSQGKDGDCAWYGDPQVPVVRGWRGKCPGRPLLKATPSGTQCLRVGRQVGPQAPDRWAVEPGPLCPPLRLPTGLEDVSKYPDLIAELLRRQWTEEEVRGALADNLLRVFEAVEQVRRAPTHPAPRQAGGQAAWQPNRVCVHRQATTAAPPRRSPSLGRSWKTPAGPTTATRRPPGSTTSQGPCWPPSPPPSSACDFHEALGTVRPGLRKLRGDWAIEHLGLQNHDWPVPSRHLGTPGQHAAGAGAQDRGPQRTLNKGTHPFES